MPPNITSMSLHQVAKGSGQTVFVYGDGFTGATEMSVGDTRVEVRVDGDTTITLHPPDLDPGDYWVQVHGPDGSSALVDSTQVLSIVDSSADPSGGGTGGGTAVLTLTSLTPDQISLGRSDLTYWLQGTGLSGVTAVMLGSAGCRFEGYEDTRMVLHPPDAVPEVQGEGWAKLSALGTAGSAELDVYCSTPAAPTPTPIGEDEHRWPMVWGVDPQQLPATGGDVRVTGANFTMGTRCFFGDIECEVSNISDTALTATLPPGRAQEGQFLPAFVMDTTVQGTNSDNHGVAIVSAV